MMTIATTPGARVACFDARDFMTIRSFTQAKLDYMYGSVQLIQGWRISYKMWVNYCAYLRVHPRMYLQDSEGRVLLAGIPILRVVL